ncbi:MAG: hypothetical protein DMG21_19615 [Acidobacteria bacterium]|nr:MAG: hypothetical protein DMG21_19615 [Acidobacteriota bacterium]
MSKVNAQTFGPGDRVLLEGGHTFDGNLVLDERSSANPQQPITIGSFGKGRAVIQGGLGTGILVRNLGGVVIRNLVVAGEDTSKNQGFGIMVLNEHGTARLDSIRIENVDVSGFHWAGIYVGGAPTILRNFGAHVEGRYGFRDVLISRSTVHHNMYNGILISGPWSKVPGGYANEDVTIRDCVVHDTPGDPLYAHHSGDGILVDDTDGGLIDHCTAYQNGGAKGSRKDGPVGIWADASNRITIQFCESYANRSGGDTDGGGFDLDGGVSNSILQYNYSHDNDGVGFLVWNYKYAGHPLANNIIRYNLTENDGRKHFCGSGEIRVGTQKITHSNLFNCGSIEVGTHHGAPVENIAVYNNTVLATKHGDRIPTGIWVGGGPINLNITIRNNLVITDGTGPLVVAEKGQTGVLFQGNAYWAQGHSFLVSYGGIEYRDLATWRAQTGQETLDGKDVGMFVDPHVGPIPMQGAPVGARGFPSSLSFHLLSGSPLVDAGLNLHSMFGVDVGSRDLWGTLIPQGQAFDVGAFEAPGRDVKTTARSREGP